MSESLPAAQVLRALTSDRHIRFSALDASPLWDGVRRGHPHLEAEACATLVELLAGALLLQARTFFSERLQLLLRTSGRARAVVADSWPAGDIRGMLDPGPGDSGPWIQGPGTLQVMRSVPSGQPYIGTLELVEGPIQTQLEAYLQQSEQVQASMTLWCDPATGESGGLLVEPMPNCPPERLALLVEALEGLEVVPLWERTPAFLSSWVNQGEGAEVLSTTAMEYRCRCSRESLLEALAGFGKERTQELFKEGHPVQVVCEYCGKDYLVAPEDLPAAGDGSAP
jgi:molecular chaperone Hsp33